MKIFKGMILAFAMTGLSLPAYASLHVEPFLGYHMGEMSNGGKEDMKGTELGARVGFSTLGFAIGGEFSKANYKLDTSPSVDVEPTNMGVFASFQFPILIRAYASYIINTKADYSPVEFEGNGTRIGVGFTGLPFIAINVEYLKLSYDKCNAAFACSVDNDIDMYGVNVSLPLNFF